MAKRLTENLGEYDRVNFRKTPEGKFVVQIVVGDIGVDSMALDTPEEAFEEAKSKMKDAE